jgi:homogentisate 1,2-dioxygenase
MTFYQRQGMLPPRRFTVLERESGGYYHEELMSSEGFSGASSTLYRLNPPTRIRHVRDGGATQPKFYDGVPDNMLFLAEQVISSGDCGTARVPLFGNDDVLYSVCRPTAATPGFYRNGGADELIFVVRGAGLLESAFGRLPYRERDLVVIPRGVTHRWVPDGQPQDMVVLETTSPVGPPARYRSSTGQLLDSAPYHERDIRAPKLGEPADEAGEYTIVVKAGGHAGEFVFDRHPFDVVGWDGYLYPYALNLDDFEPISGRVHPLPDQYQVFAARGVAVCAMVPHPNASDPRANPAQAHHMNVDYDELMYRFVKQENDPLSRTITLHPRSLAHGPKPGFDAMPISPFLDMWSYMVDTTQPLRVTVAAMEVRDDDYRSAWL